MTRGASLFGALLGGAAIYAVALGLGTGPRSSAARPRPAEPTLLRSAPETLVPAAGVDEAAPEGPTASMTEPPPLLEDEASFRPRPDPVAGLVYGRVLDEEGEAIDGDAYVIGYDPDGARLQVKADARGRYSIAGLRPGRWRLVGSARRHWDAVDFVELESGQAPLRHDWRLEHAPVVKVRVTAPDGAPITELLQEEGLSVFGLLPVATAEPPGPVLSEVVGSYNNGFGVGAFWESGFNGERLPPEYLGVLVLDRELPVHVSLVHYQGVLATQLVEVGADETAFVLDPATLRASLAGLRVRLVDAETGDPLTGRADLNDLRSWSPGESLDETGTALFAGKPPGRYTLSFRSAGRERVQESVVLEPGRVLDLGTLALEAGHSLKARVLDPEGRPARASFELGERTGDPRALRFDWTHEYESEAGELRIEGLPAGDFVLRGAGNDDDPYASPSVEFSTRAGSVEDLVIRLAPAVLLSLQPSDIRPREEPWRFQLFDAAGYRVSAGTIAVWGRRLAVAPGRYELVLEGPTGESASRRLDLREPTSVHVP